MKRKNILAMFMIFVTLIAFAPTTEVGASAAQRARMRELQAQRDQARTQVQDTENLLRGVRADIAELFATIREYDQRLLDAQADLEEIELVLLETEIRMIDATEELVQARIDRDEQDEVFRTRLRAMHEQGRAGYLNVLLQASSFTDFLIRLEHVRAISQQDNEILATMQALEDSIENTVGELARLAVLFESLYEQQQVAIIALNDAQEAHHAFMSALEYDEANVEMRLLVEQETENAIRIAMGYLQREIDVYEEEAARRQREQEELDRQNRLRQQQAQVPVIFEGDWAWPVPGHTHITSRFGSRIHPIRRTSENHSGIDIRAGTGTRIVAAADGIVTHSGSMGGYGITVIINHGGGYSTLYAHNSRNRVSVGQSVTRGQHIADVGSTGVSTGPHLHFEIRRNGTPINPEPFFR